jgi:uncharacterized Zn-binding protein involved in type VI secretion
MGDTTNHGGTIVAGAPTVLIGGAPAARINDMHVCPMMNPGTPPPPHVGGPILMGSFTVLIGGQPAARVGDMCQCSGPPDSIAMGCTTVLIGTSGGGGGAGMAGAGGKTAESERGGDAGESQVVTGDAGETEEADTETHFLDVTFVDKGGKPITGVAYTIKSPDNKTDSGILFGKLKKTGVKPGDYEIELKAITKAEWSKKKARDGETVKMLVETVGFEDGTKATFEVWERGANKADKKIATVEDVVVKGNKLEAVWQYVWDEDESEAPSTSSKGRKYSFPKYYFKVTVGNSQAKSTLLDYKDYVEIHAKDEEGNPLKQETYRVYLADGEIREGRLDDQGYAKIEEVPPGEWDVEFPDIGKPKQKN